MLWENNSTIVVMLTKLREMGRVSVANSEMGFCDILLHILSLGSLFFVSISWIMSLF